MSLVVECFILRSGCCMFLVCGQFVFEKKGFSDVLLRSFCCVECLYRG